MCEQQCLYLVGFNVTECLYEMNVRTSLVQNYSAAWRIQFVELGSKRYA